MHLIIASLNSLIRSGGFDRSSREIKSRQAAHEPARRGRFSKRLRRRVLIFAIISSLQILPQGLGFRPQPVHAYSGVEFSGTPTGYVPFIMKALLWFVTPAQRPQTLAERNSVVTSIQIRPHRFVGYIGDQVTFTGMGLGANRQPAHGAKFDWESSDASKLEIDEAGRATLHQPGLVRVTCRTATAAQSAAVLIRPTRRRLQTDDEWRADQDSLTEPASGPSGFLDALPSLLEKVAPTGTLRGTRRATTAT